MTDRPAVTSQEERAWETWPADQIDERGQVWWRTLISAGATPTSTLSLGVARIAPGAALNAHRHEQAEVYLVLAGSGELTIDGATRTVKEGDAVFIPGGATHALACAGSSELRFTYAFAADSTGDVVYDFDRRGVTRPG